MGYKKTPFLPYSDFTERMMETICLTDMDESIYRMENYILAKLVSYRPPFLHRLIDDVELNTKCSIKSLSEKTRFQSKDIYQAFENLFE